MINKAKQKTGKKSTPSVAQRIYAAQKKDYRDMLNTKIRQGKKVTVAAREAGEAYRKMYGATPQARWKNALRQARLSKSSSIDSQFL